MTCFSKDYGYEKVFSKSLEFYADKGDVVIIISSSGRSKNLIEAAKICNIQKYYFIHLLDFQNQIL